MKATKPAKKSTQPTTKSATGASAQGRRNEGVPANKNSKESFIKKLQLCMKNYDYKDEQKDVKGKTERLNAIQELQQMLQD
jgi:hypothetical protein